MERYLPWTVSRGGDDPITQIVDARGHVLAQLLETDGGGVAELMALAPELLLVCKQLQLALRMQKNDSRYSTALLALDEVVQRVNGG